jgi:hypothetical protein
MKRRSAILVLMLAFAGGPIATAARAAVVVLANRTEEEVRFHVSSTARDARAYTLARGEVLPLPTTGRLDLIFSVEGKRNHCRLEPNEIYFFVASPKGVAIRRIGFTGSWDRAAPPATEELPAPETPAAKIDRILLKIPVKILVDQGEPTVRKVWEKRLRERVAAASVILEQQCRVQLEVIDVGTWESDARLTTLTELLHDFEKKVAVRPARLALGFTGRVVSRKQDTALGCTSGPLHPHILIREWKPRTEADRLEVLVHELGHFLGASHSPEADSVMRPKLGDGRANFRAFRIGFDPINLLAVNLIVEEIARRPARRLGELTPSTRKRLIEIFSTLARTTPNDPAAPRFIRLLGGTPPEPLPLRKLPDEVLDGARSVVAAIVSAAKQRERLRLTGDALTAHYCQAAAAASRRLPAEHAVPAYLLGLAIALDRVGLLHALPLRGIAWEKIETDAERTHRLEVLGEPTMHGRSATVQYFVVSGALSVLVEEQAVSAAGVLKELLLIQGGDTFRFDDLSATLAGITFATQLDASPGLLAELATSFRISDYTLSPKGLPDSLSRAEFARRYGSLSDAHFLRQQDALRKRLLVLPGYQPR